jgi:hypothetical protein
LTSFPQKNEKLEKGVRELLMPPVAMLFGGDDEKSNELIA